MRSAAFDAIVAAGVERTIRDVARELVGSAMPLGVIPTGTGNVFARELGYSFAPFALARTLQAGTVESIHLGEVNGDPFLSVVGAGFDAEAVRHFETINPRSLGRASFVYPVLRALMGRPPGPLTVETDSGRYRAHWVIVSRVKTLRWRPSADPGSRPHQTGHVRDPLSRGWANEPPAPRVGSGDWTASTRSTHFDRGGAARNDHRQPRIPGANRRPIHRCTSARDRPASGPAKCNHAGRGQLIPLACSRLTLRRNSATPGQRDRHPCVRRLDGTIRPERESACEGPLITLRRSLKFRRLRFRHG